MKINITSGDCLNELLENKYKDETFVPFCEAMINGEYHHELFSEEFMQERASFHNVSLQEYKTKLKGFLNLLKNINDYDEIVLWFGDEPFCQTNTKIVLKTLKEYQYKGKLILNIVNEETCEILQTINERV